MFKTSVAEKAVSSATNLDVTQRIPRGRTKSVNIRLTVSCHAEYVLCLLPQSLISSAAVLLRGLDALTTEDSVLTTLRDCTELPIKRCRIGRDSATNLSRGVCYVEMNSVSDAMFLHNRLLGEPPTIDDRLVGVSYYRSPQEVRGGGGGNAGSAGSSAASAAMAAAQWSHQGIEQHMSDDEIEKMAKSAAEMYGKTAEETAHYLEYYRNYYKNGGGGEASAGSAPSADAKKKTENDKELGKVTVNGVDYKKYRKLTHS